MTVIRVRSVSGTFICFWREKEGRERGGGGGGGKGNRWKGGRGGRDRKNELGMTCLHDDTSEQRPSQSVKIKPQFSDQTCDT